jgi:hypothetical protein
MYKHRKRKKNRSVAQAMHHDQWIRDIAHYLSGPHHCYVELSALVGEANSSHEIHRTPLDGREQCQESIWRDQHTVCSMRVDWSPVSIRRCGKFVHKKCKFFMLLLLQNWVWTADRIMQGKGMAKLLLLPPLLPKS